MARVWQCFILGRWCSFKPGTTTQPPYRTLAPYASAVTMVTAIITTLHNSYYCVPPCSHGLLLLQRRPRALRRPTDNNWTAKQWRYWIPVEFTIPGLFIWSDPETGGKELTRPPNGPERMVLCADWQVPFQYNVYPQKHFYKPPFPYHIMAKYYHHNFLTVP